MVMCAADQTGNIYNICSTIVHKSGTTLAIQSRNIVNSQLW